MNVLLLSYFFPPYNSIGAIRVGKFARYLSELGHDVRVVTADRPVLEQQDASLKVEIERNRVVYTRWFDLNALVRKMAGIVQRSRSETPGSVTPTLDSMPERLRGFSKLYLSLTNIPDAFWGWQPYAVRAARSIARSTTLDVIIASGPPFSAFQVASRLSATTGVPWVADFRDYWADKQHYPFFEWRRQLDRGLERSTMRNAAGLVSVSAPMIDLLSSRYRNVPHAVILNGFDPGDFAENLAPDAHPPLVMRYTGTLFYVGNSDPSVLFEALLRLGEERADVRMEFIVRDHAPRVEQMATEAGVADCVRVLPPVSYSRSLKLQQTSDVLVLIMPGRGGPTWNGVYSGKFFEYCGAGRPILTIAGDQNVAALAVRTHGLGLASTNPDEIATWLHTQIAAKKDGGLRRLDPSRVSEFTRRRQTEYLESFLQQCVIQRR